MIVVVKQLELLFIVQVVRQQTQKQVQLKTLIQKRRKNLLKKKKLLDISVLIYFSTAVKSAPTAKKDQHRHSLEGYDLNNVAGK